MASLCLERASVKWSSQTIVVCLSTSGGRQRIWRRLSDAYYNEELLPTFCDASKHCHIHADTTRTVMAGLPSARRDHKNTSSVCKL